MPQHWLFSRQDKLHVPLYVVTPIFNPVRFRTRWKHYQDFAKRVEEGGAVLITVEAAFGRRDFAVTDAGNPHHVQVRAVSELWLKETLINRGVARLSELYPDWPKVAWVDADVNFERDDVMDDTRHALEHYDVVQMWSVAQDMDPHGEPLPNMSRSFAHCHVSGVPRDEHKKQSGYYYHPHGRRGYYWHPGYAWAATREWWEGVGGLIDWAIIGNGDLYMAEGMCGNINEDSTYKSPSASYTEMMEQWQMRCIRSMNRGNRGGLGCVPGLITHKWHGNKADRQYATRWKLLIETGFDPLKHLKRDRNLLWTLDESAPLKLRDGLRRYARARNEDSI